MYSFSQGLEKAVDDGWITGAETAREWIFGILTQGLARTDAPILVRLQQAWQKGDEAGVGYWTHNLLSWRETLELRLEDRHVGQALARLLSDLGFTGLEKWRHDDAVTFATLFSLAACQWRIPPGDAVLGYLWSWLDNQILCAVKLVPLGQTAGQRLLTELSDCLPHLVEQALRIDDAGIGGGAFGLALASSRHERQYSRLFRS